MAWGEEEHKNFVDIHLFKAVMPEIDFRELKILYDIGLLDIKISNENKVLINTK